MNEFDELLEAWTAFTAPFWDAIGRIKDKLTQIMDKLVEEENYEKK